MKTIEQFIEKHGDNLLRGAVVLAAFLFSFVTWLAFHSV